MKCQTLFQKEKARIINLSSVKIVQMVPTVKPLFSLNYIVLNYISFSNVFLTIII